MKKQVIAAMLSLAMAVTMVPSYAFAADSDAVETQAVETAEQLATKKTTAKTDMYAYWGVSIKYDGTKKEEKSAAAYDDADADKIRGIQSTAAADINAAGTIAEIDEIVKAAKESIDKIQSKNEKRWAAKDEAKKTIKAYFGTDATYPDEVYDPAVLDKIEAKQGEYCKKVNEVADATAIADIDKLVKEAKAEIDKFETIEECKTRVVDAITKSHADVSDYTDAEQAKIKTDREKAIADVNAMAENALKVLKTVENDNATVGGVNDKMDKVLTTFEGTFDKYGSKLGTAKKNATDEIQALKNSVWSGEYNTEQTQSITAAYNAYKEKIDNAKTVADVEALAKEFKDLVAEYPKSNTDARKALVQKLIAATKTAEFKAANYDAIKEADGLLTKLGSVDATADGEDAVTAEKAVKDAKAKYDADTVGDITDAIATAKFGTDGVNVTAETYTNYKTALEDIQAKIESLFDGSTWTDKENTTAGKAYNGAKGNYEKAAAAVTAFETYVKKVNEDGKLTKAATYADINATGTYKDVYDAYKALKDAQKAQISDEVKAIYDKVFGDVEKVVAAKDAAQKLINNLPKNVTKEDKDAIAAARAAVEAITDKDAKTDVRTTALTDSEKKYVNILVKEIGYEAGKTEINDDVIAKYNAAKEAYDEYTKYNDKDTTIANSLKAVKDAIDAHNKNLAAAAKAEAEKAFAAVKDVTEVTADNKAAVDAAIAAYETYAKYDKAAADKAYADKVAALEKLVKAYEDANKEAAKDADFDYAKLSVATVVNYTGKAQKPAVKVTDKSGKVVDSANYTVAYSNNTKVGKATVKVTAKEGSGYTGTVSANFIVKPLKETIKVTAGKKKITVTANAQAGATYKVVYKVNGKTKVIRTKNAKTTIKNLPSGKKCAVRVVAYVTVDGKNVTGASSAVKKIKVK